MKNKNKLRAIAMMELPLVLAGIAIFIGLTVPLVGKMKLAGHPTWFALVAVYGGITALCVFLCIIERMAKKLGLQIGGGASEPRWEDGGRYVGAEHFSRKVKIIRHSIQCMVVAFCCSMGIVCAVNFYPPQWSNLSPLTVAFIYSAAWLLPSALIIWAVGSLSPKVRRFLTTRAVFVPLK